MPLPVVGCVLALVLLRLLLVAIPASADESGFLMVARQWHPGGSLYGDYWVDRPPLLVTLFRVPAVLGGVVALRGLGCVAAATTVVILASTGRLLGGRRVQVSCAVVAAALLASPLMGTFYVNGELLSAPFVAAGVLLALCTLDDRRDDRRRLWCAAGAGGAACAALLVKQNMADVVVFAGVAWLVARRTLPVRAWVAAVGGGLAVVVVVAAWTLVHGTSLTGVYDAMYPFRLRAAGIVGGGQDVGRGRRLRLLVRDLVLTGVPLVMLALVVAVARRRVRGPVVAGVLAMLGFTLLSVLAGGAYWPHYLVEAVVPVTLALALLLVQRVRGARVLLVVLVVAAVVPVVTFAAGDHSLVVTRGADPQTRVAAGRAVARAARDGDTAVNAFGNANVVLASGLSSPYPYLWTLPARTLDPGLRRLAALLRGPAAPTWFVVQGAGPPELGRGPADVALHGRYREVARVCDSTVYLRDGVHRPAPRGRGCRAPVPLAALLRR